jgi:hypothetical protein
MANSHAAGIASILLATSLVGSAACAAEISPETMTADQPEPQGEGNQFLFVPYPITEPAVGSGVLAGLVWMRAGPKEESGPSKPQAYGVGALWTDGGSRGAVAFDHRAWAGGVWRSTAVGTHADIRLIYSGLSPEEDQDRGFNLRLNGGSLQVDRSFGKGPNSAAVRIFSFVAKTGFGTSTPPELATEALEEQIRGVRLSWTQDTRDEIYAPSRGHVSTVAATVYPKSLGASFDAQSLSLKWAGYRAGAGKGVLGLRLLLDSSYGHPPFYLRPYVSLRGVAALRYPGERAASAEAEYRYPVGTRWDLLAFAGIGAARSDRHDADGEKTVTAGGVGIRFKAKKLFGLTLGLDFAEGPDGSVTYIQIGNAWGR